ncbi:hypothetical protein KQX54_004001 [Cotesia glomerata]|uniref:Secreted protein n=1 Tax=Cotesia glomerata TaxID=32391 RepID=A0AAV7J5A1_COTGL|nr:hypothetical protein KQX54_004001 [Cotesia glomerata]
MAAKVPRIKCIFICICTWRVVVISSVQGQSLRPKIPALMHHRCTEPITGFVGLHAIYWCSRALFIHFTRTYCSLNSRCNGVFSPSKNKSKRRNVRIHIFMHVSSWACVFVCICISVEKGSMKIAQRLGMLDIPLTSIRRDLLQQPVLRQVLVNPREVYCPLPREEYGNPVCQRRNLTIILTP